MPESGREPDSPPLEPQVREAAGGRSERTPFLLIGGIAGTIAVVAGVLMTILLLLWWAL